MDDKKILHIENLLTNVSHISKKYDEIAKITGENFNIFSVMRMESDEVKTHSRVIAELLNPKGSHSQGSIFLKLFFAEIKELSKIEDFDFENAKVLVEEHIGLINEDYTKGGYIDISIKDNNNQIVIENKIYAVDQFGQLLRYKNHYPECKLLYLTLDCKEPSDESKGNLVLGYDFHCISYENNILDWLNKCQKETVDIPMLREMIKQYSNLIKKLTGKLNNQKMESDIKELIKRNLLSAGIINKYFDEAKFEICERIRFDLKNKLDDFFQKKYDIEINQDIKVRNSHIWLKNKIYKKENPFFGIEPINGFGNFGGKLFIGILDLENKNEQLFRDNSKLTIDGWWRERRDFEDFEGFNIDFSSIEFLQFLVKNTHKQDQLIESLSKQAINYINENEGILLKIYAVIENENF